MKPQNRALPLSSARQLGFSSALHAPHAGDGGGCLSTDRSPGALLLFSPLPVARPFLKLEEVEAGQTVD